MPTPSDSESRTPKRRLPFRRPKSPMWFGMVFLGLWLIASVISSVLHQGETLDYSQFKSLLAQGQIVEVQIGKAAIQGKYQTGDGQQKAFTSVRVDGDTELTKQLEEKKVKY